MSYSTKYNHKIILVFLLIFLHLRPVYSQLMDVPVDIQYPLLLKILTFDRNFGKKTNGALKIGILYQEEWGKSVETKNELIEIIKNSSFFSLGNIPVRYQAIRVSEHSDIKSQLKNNNINVLYVTPMRMIKINDISYSCRESGILSFSGVIEYIESGLSIGVTLKNDKPQILINVKSARAEGSDFDSRLLKISKIIE